MLSQGFDVFVYGEVMKNASEPVQNPSPAMPNASSRSGCALAKWDFEQAHVVASGLNASLLLGFDPCGKACEITQMTGGDGMHDGPVDAAVAVHGEVAESNRLAQAHCQRGIQ